MVTWLIDLKMSDRSMESRALAYNTFIFDG